MIIGSMNSFFFLSISDMTRRKLEGEDDDIYFCTVAHEHVRTKFDVRTTVAQDTGKTLVSASRGKLLLAAGSRSATRVSCSRTSTCRGMEAVQRCRPEPAG